MPPDGASMSGSGGVQEGARGGTPGDRDAPVTDAQRAAAAARPDRPHIIAFVVSPETEMTLREGLMEAVPEGFAIHRGNVRAAMAALQKMPISHNLIIDVSGESQPLSALSDLSDVVVPDVRVLVIGDRDDLNFYRQVTRGLVMGAEPRARVSCAPVNDVTAPVRRAGHAF